MRLRGGDDGGDLEHVSGDEWDDGEGILNDELDVLVIVCDGCKRRRPGELILSDYVIDRVYSHVVSTSTRHSLPEIDSLLLLEPNYNSNPAHLSSNHRLLSSDSQNHPASFIDSSTAGFRLGWPTVYFAYSPITPVSSACFHLNFFLLFPSCRRVFLSHTRNLKNLFLRRFTFQRFASRSQYCHLHAHAHIR